MKFSFDFWHTGRSKHRVTLLAGLRARPGQQERVRKMLYELAEATRNERTCVCYIPHQSSVDPELFTIYQVWESQEQLEGHARTQHTQYFRAEAPALLEGPVLHTHWRILD
jgi:quinol monooxygenase YgiN